jgi:hypothetical protein
MEESHVLSILAIVIFAIYEFTTGLNGKLMVNISQSIRLRYAFRGFYISNFILMWEQYYRLYVDISYYNNFYYRYYYDINELYDSFQSSLLLYAILFLFAELMILMRDHLPKFYPLEPEFRPVIRLFTPPYLLTMSGLFIFLTGPRYNELVMAGSVLFMAGTLWAKIRHYKVSPRFYIVSILFIFYTAIVLDDEIILPVLSVVSFYLAFVILKSLRKFRPRIRIGGFSRIKKMYSDYYKE